MGGSVSHGFDNDELINNLVEATYIRTPAVEKVFRTVDRAFYYLPDFRFLAYRDLAWKHGNLHLSAPSIYCEVLEHLHLEPGRSFLNIGSGTGYLSTMAGLILGPYGINHGIEIQPDVVDYAYERLEQFKKTSNVLDMFEFCEPYFAVGNGLDLNPDRRYDRIYCGAACSQAHHEHIKKYLKINGILIVPCEVDLLKIVRTSETNWETTSVLSVSFSTLQSPEKLSRPISIPEPQPLLLQELCRSKIRCLLRDLVKKENPMCDVVNNSNSNRLRNIRRNLGYFRGIGHVIIQDDSSISSSNSDNEYDPSLNSNAPQQDNVEENVEEADEQVPTVNKVLNLNLRRQADEENSQPKKLLKREKLDSGISEESDDGEVSRSYESSFLESPFSEPKELESDDSETSRSGEVPVDTSDEKTDDEKRSQDTNTRSLKYRLLIEKRIQCLPLPQRLKIYLNHGRDFCVETH